MDVSKRKRPKPSSSLRGGRSVEEAPAVIRATVFDSNGDCLKEYVLGKA